MAAESHRSPSTAAGRPYVSEVSVVTGAAKETEMTLTGFRQGVDYLDSVISVTKEGSSVKDITSTIKVVKDGKIETSGEDAKEAAGVLVFWRRRVP